MLNILYCVDGGARGRSWLEYSIKSVLKHHGADNLRIFVASDSEYRRVGTTWIDARPYIKAFGLSAISSVIKEGRHPSPMQIFRLAAPCVRELSGVDTVLYIDIDTEILSSGILDLPWDGVGADVSALYEHSAHGNKSTEVMLASRELVDMMDDDTVKRLKSGGYFNSGVMLMDLKYMRVHHPRWKDDLPHVVQMAVKHHRCVVDQDICNVVLTAKPIDPRFNVMPSTDVFYDVSNPCILHYANSSKYRSELYPPSDVRNQVARVVDDGGKVPDFVRKAYVSALCFTGMKDRHPSLMDELNRMGICDVAHVQWGFPSPFEGISFRNIPHIVKERPEVWWGVTLMHYGALKTAYELGMEHAMVIEDDCRFLKDVKKVWNTVGSAPPDWDILMLSNFLREGVSDVGGGWLRCKKAMSAACYICNRKAMKKLVELYEAPARRAAKARPCDYWTDSKFLGGDIRMYVANPVLAVQAKIGNHGEEPILRQVEMGVDMSLYSK